VSRHAIRSGMVCSNRTDGQTVSAPVWGVNASPQYNVQYLQYVFSSHMPAFASQEACYVRVFSARVFPDKPGVVSTNPISGVTHFFAFFLYKTLSVVYRSGLRHFFFIQWPSDGPAGGAQGFSLTAPSVLYVSRRPVFGCLIPICGHPMVKLVYVAFTY
jgi:hypothetical protein